MVKDRRDFLQLLSAGAMSAAFPSSIARALAIPANNRTGTIDDVEHIVILMQENRSFDHYFGTLRGVRGFGDPRAMALPSGRSVFYQPDGAGYVLPFHPDAPDLGLVFLENLIHDWTSTHLAWNGGKYDQWVRAKTSTSMAHLERGDIPFHYALADAFTICDAYHCSLLGPTSPNRYYMWTGWTGNDGKHGGPVVNNDQTGFSWSTYPERLQAANISWKIYQDVGKGLTAAGRWGETSDAYIGNYGDNSLLYFYKYQDAAAGSPLANGAKTGTDISRSGTLVDQLKHDIATNSLPQVSWVVAPEAYTEHPNWPANYGAYYISQILDALTTNPDVWSKTVFLLTYDENDGFFDHMAPPTVPQSQAHGYSTVTIENEVFPGSAQDPPGPYGMGIRVPMIAISPWSRGGYVNSQVFDHTSMIRLIEQRFGRGNPTLQESNITDWRRAVSGDLTSAFNFATPNDVKVTMPSTAAYKPLDNRRHPSYMPVPPLVQALPSQESGQRPTRALPYVLDVRASLSSAGLHLELLNTGTAAAVFQVRPGNSATGPWTYTVSPHTELSVTFALSKTNPWYSLLVYGPNGFLRTFKGSLNDVTNIEVSSAYHVTNPGIELTLHNQGVDASKISIRDVYTGQTTKHTVGPAQSASEFRSLGKSQNWYDLIISAESDSGWQQRLAGHVETGQDSMTDPAIGS